MVEFWEIRKGLPFNHTAEPVMTFHLQSPAGDLATFQAIYDGWMSFACGRDVVELPIADARKVWRALCLCQWQRIDSDALLIYQGIA